MKAIFAPWRLEYILSEKPTDCVFCTRIEQDQDEPNLILYRGKKAVVFLNKYPYNNGHLMVMPYRHTALLDELDEAQMLEMFELVRLCCKTLTKTMQPDGFNIGINLGDVAGAGIRDHIHIHVVPRWEGDTNFMPVFAETKSIPEHLTSTYRKLYRAINELDKEQE